MKKRLNIWICMLVLVLCTGCSTSCTSHAGSDDINGAIEDGSDAINDDDSFDEKLVYSSADVNGDNTIKSTADAGDNSNSNYKKVKSDDEEYKLYEKLFDINNKVSIKINISNEELAKIQKDYERYSSIGSKSPIYRVADSVTFIINGEEYTIEEVGIRMKGNTSRTSFYDYQDGIDNLVHFRLSFDETFDDETYYGEDAKVWSSDAERKERKKRTFATLNSLEIKWNKNYDSTYIREYFTHKMFQDYGVLCPNMNITSIDIGKEHYGVWFMYEPVDKKFLEKNLDEKDLGGDLYKCGWTDRGSTYTKDISYGVDDEQTSEFYNYDLKTNKDTSSHDSLINLIRVLDKSEGVTKEEYESIVDVDYWINFAAVSYFSGDPDNMRNNYNNHYVYFLKSSGKAIFIPYDSDRVLGCTYGWNPTGNGLTEVSPYSQWAQGLGGNQDNPLYIYSVCRGGYYVQEYRTLLIDIIDSKWLQFDTFKNFYDIAYKNQNSNTIIDDSIDNVNKNGLSFRITGGGINSSENISVETYLKAIISTVREKINDYQ